MATTTTTATTTTIDRHLTLAIEDLSATGRSTAAERTLRIAQQDADQAERMATTLARQQERRAAIVAIRERYWAARGRRTRSRQ